MSLQPDGIAGQIARLKIGTSLSLTTRFPSRAPKIDEKARDARAHLKNKMAPHVARAKAHVPGTYKTETAVSLSHDYTAVLVTVAVTRIS